MSASRSLRWIKRGLLALYTFQIALVVWWEILPMERREANGLRYEIRRGFAPLLLGAPAGADARRNR